jgi:putative endopeptidase
MTFITRLLAAAAPLALLATAPSFAQEAAPVAAPPQLLEPEPMRFPEMGIDITELDPAVDPGNDFYAYVNGKWRQRTEIPPQFAGYGVFTNLDLGAQRNLRTIVETMAAANAPAGSIEQRVGDAYKAYLDAAAIEARGMAPVQPFLDRIAKVTTREELAALFAQPGYPAPISAYVSIDSKNPTANTVYANVGGLGLPDRDNYLVDTPKNLEMRAKYKDYLAFMLGKARYEDPRAAAEAVYDLEHQIAELDWDRAVSRDPQLTYNRVTRDELAAMSGGFPVRTLLEGLKLGDIEALVVGEIPPTPAKIKALKLKPSDRAKLGGGVPALLKLMNEAPLATWQAWSAAHFLRGMASYLPSDIDDANFAFYGQYLQGRQVQRERWRRALAVTEGAMGEALGKLYVERHFPPENKAAMLELVANLRKAMAESIAESKWMGPATRKEAEAKLAAFTVKIGYPDKFETYEGLEITATDPVANAIAAGKWAWEKDLRELKEPVDKAKWLMTPQTVNAYYMPPANEIVFPAAFLQAPNFSLKADPAVNYGAIGSVIGHEIGHGFDDKGSQYAGTGALRSWWTPQDRQTFDQLGGRLAAQYGKVCPLDEGKTCLNGKLTLGENIGDLTGVTMAYRAYKMSLGGKDAPIIDGLTGDQRFFIAYAQAWREESREELQRQRILTDPHSPSEARVNQVLRNFDPWYAAFDVKAGDKLYLPPAQRVRIW